MIEYRHIYGDIEAAAVYFYSQVYYAALFLFDINGRVSSSCRSSTLCTGQSVLSTAARRSGKQCPVPHQLVGAVDRWRLPADIYFDMSDDIAARPIGLMSVIMP